MRNCYVTNQKDFLLGGLLLAVGILGITSSWHLEAGTLLNMGAGYLPKVLSVALACFGLAIGTKGFVRKGAPIEWVWRPVIVVLGAFALFAILIETTGLFIAAFATVAVARLATPGARPVETAVYALVMAAACTLVFSYLIGIPVKVWPI